MVSESLVDILAIVSSDPDSAINSSRFLGTGLARSVQLFRSGGELLKVLSYDPSLGDGVVLIDSVVSDIAPLNLVDSIRAAEPGLDVIVALDSPDGAHVQRAMLAGARAAVHRNCSDADLETALRRVVAARPMLTAGSSRGLSTSRGSVVSVIGARGGAGRSTLSIALSLIAAHGGLNVALLDLDFQYGDLGLLGDVEPELTAAEMLEVLSVSDVGEHSRVGQEVSPGLVLYEGRPQPERADAAFARVGSAIAALTTIHELVIVNTGAYGALGHVALLDSTDHAVCVLDQSVAGVRSTRRLLGAIGDIGFGPSRTTVVVNRTNPRGGHASDIADALGLEHVWMVPDGGREIAMALDSGMTDAILDSQSAFTPAVSAVLDEVASRTGLAIHGMSSMRSALRHSQRKRGWWR